MMQAAMMQAAMMQAAMMVGRPPVTPQSPATKSSGDIERKSALPPLTASRSTLDGHDEGVIIIGARRLVLPAVLMIVMAVTACTSGAGAATGDTAVASGGTSDTSVPLGSASSGTTTAAHVPEAPTDSPTPVSRVFAERVVQLAPGSVDEASGIVASRQNPGAYFLVDDGLDSVTAVGADGTVIATIGVDGMSEQNAEAISGGGCGSPPPDGSTATNCLYVGGIGDNSSRRRDISVFRLAEPELTAPPTEPVPADEWLYSYPEGAQDAEGMMIDADGSVVIVTKPDRGSPTRIYRGAPGGGELTLVREFTPPSPAIPMRTVLTGNVVVDVSSEPGRVLLLTYDELQEYTAPDPGVDITSFPDWPHHRLPMPSLPQPEGITGELDGCGYVVASEAGPGGDNGSLAFVSCG